MKSTKLVIATIASLMILASLFTAIKLTYGVSDPAAWYTVANGNLDSDYYMLFPFEQNSVSYGFSKFGELIGILPGQDQSMQANWVGMMYDGRDPFAPLDTVPMTSWINGWYLDINYIDPAVAGAGKDRHLFAFAMFGDGYAAGGDWQSVTTPSGAPHGGRKTNGLVTTDNMKILYDGPRLFVAQSVNHIFDKEGQTSWPVVDLTLTMIFTKVDKQVMLYKDVKITIPKMHIWGKLNVQLSNREEYDLGESPGYASYAHFYEEAGYTSYTPDWHMASNLLRDRVEHQVGVSQKTVFTLNIPDGLPLANDYMKVYIDGVFVDPSVSPAPYTVDWNEGTVTFNTAPAAQSDVVFNYKYIFKEPSMILDGRPLVSDGMPSWSHVYDIAQVISSDGEYVAWAAMWPPTSDHTVDGILRFLNPLIEISESDMSSEPKQSPLIIGEWDFLMDHATMPMFRGVEVKGIANNHNGDDAQRGGYNVIDTEVQYWLDKVFMPWDLNTAIEGKLNTWVQYYTVTENDYEYMTTHPAYYFYIPLERSPVHYANWWEGYNVNAERVFLDGTLLYPERQESTIGNPADYRLYIDANGVGYIQFASEDIEAGSVIKMIYSTDVSYTEHPFYISTVSTLLGNATGTQYFDWGYSGNTLSDSWTDNLSVHHDVFTDDYSFSLRNVTASTETENLTWIYDGEFEWEAEPFLVPGETGTYMEIGADNFPIMNVTAEGESQTMLEMQIQYLELNWEIMYSPQGSTFPDILSVWMDNWDMDVEYQVTVSYNTVTQMYTVTPLIWFTAEGDTSSEATLYDEYVQGRYEWGVVGTNAASVDSAGLSLISATLKDKGVEYGIAGEDMYDSEIANQMPWIMSKMGSGTTWNDYYFGTTDYRVGLRDDFCTTWQITHANLVGSGGPLANMLAYYGNDFTAAFFGLSQFTTYSPWVNAIVPLSCWNGTKKGYVDSNTVGYAVISTFEDNNGTNAMLVWGNWGRDTFYAAKWFQDDGAYEFQTFPPGATSIVLRITYHSTSEGYKPTAYKVVEVLGTISETTVHEDSVVKGGIHDP
jgi:hypothetical protein